MDRFRITGPSRLQGTVAASGAKNAALPALAATLLADEPVVLRRVPKVRDIATMRRLLSFLGVDSHDRDNAVRLLPQHDGASCEAMYDMVKTMRASVLVLGALMGRRRRARVSLPGGCAIGVRPIDQHLKGLDALGAQIRLEHGYVLAETKRLCGARFRFDLQTVTGTENLMMAASLAEGETVLENCAREPEVVDLAKLLNAMGARIEGAGEETIRIDGVEQLGGAEHEIIGDRIEGGTYLIGAALTGGDVTLTGTAPGDVGPLLEVLADAGAEVSCNGAGIRVRRQGPLRPRDVVTAPHPGFPTDLQAQYLALMTQAEGTARVTETIFENRFQHVAELLRMGADIHVEGRDAVVRGPHSLSGANVMATDLRASACLVLAGVAASGETMVDRIYHLDRGYEGMEVKLQALGARVERVAGPPSP
ncbi:MAG TPA: UDP-N-acetylglucosamine 1-carboxyvinyltransferase [Thermoanaerobaculia bacterium]|jgi:UDP-N-acetylglucosamine 1-carboxyvinyltransferase|nr:UDP-N-acetylglucosamine 1-carboxyvinyltransferase [Thermoanaerobaculia bacterium]